MKIISETDNRLSFLPLEKAIVPPEDLIRHIKDNWWVVHPEKGVVFFKHSPQCNQNEEISRRIATVMYPWAYVQFLSSVFHKIDPNDYVE